MAMTMKLIHVPPRYFPAISGAEFYFMRLSELLNDKHDVEVHTTNALDFRAFHDPKGKVIKIKEGEEIHGVKVFRNLINHEPLEILEEFHIVMKEIDEDGSFTLNDLEYGPFSSDLRQSLQCKEPDLVHVTFYPYFNIYVALHTCMEKSIPCVITPFIHGENPRYKHPSISLLQKFSKILACSPSEKKFLIRRGIEPSKIHEITMGVDLHQIKDYGTSKFYQASRIPREKLIVLFIGYKNYEKGAITILKAIPRVVKRIPQAHFVMIGPPTKQYKILMHQLEGYSKYVTNYTPDNLSGYLDPIKLGALRACKVLAMPSRSEAYGIAYLEAWAAGKPVISSNIPAMRDLFTDGIHGRQVKFDHPKRLADAIIDVLSHEEKARQMGNEGFRKVKQENLTWKNVAKQVEGIYTQLARA
ncbi:glycosyltransferase [Candidatus Bathyarchaeota archaeon]|nr:glycosyltransferase [Candidatus Bathyarchaeota archaeon]